MYHHTINDEVRRQRSAVLSSTEG